MLWVHNSLRENCIQIVLRDSALAYGWLVIGHIRKRKELVMRGSILWRHTSKNALPQPTGQGASSQKEMQHFFLFCWWLHQLSISAFSCFTFVWLCATLCATLSHQAPLSMRFSRQEYWSELPFPTSGIFPTQELNLGVLHCRHILYHLSHQGNPKVAEVQANSVQLWNQSLKICLQAVCCKISCSCWVANVPRKGQTDRINVCQKWLTGATCVKMSVTQSQFWWRLIN